MKPKLIFVFILIIIFNNYLFANDMVIGELEIENKSTTDIIKVIVYPVGIVFNGSKECKLRCLNGENILNKFIVGCSKTNLNPMDGKVRLNHDASGSEPGIDGAIGYGKYRIDFYKKIYEMYHYVNYCYVDFGHSNYPWTSGFVNDVDIQYINEYTILHWSYKPLPEDRIIKIWDQRVNYPTSYEPPKTRMVLNLLQMTNLEIGLIFHK